MCSWESSGPWAPDWDFGGIQALRLRCFHVFSFSRIQRAIFGLANLCHVSLSSISPLQCLSILFLQRIITDFSFLYSINSLFSPWNWKFDLNSLVSLSSGKGFSMISEICFFCFFRKSRRPPWLAVLKIPFFLSYCSPIILYFCCILLPQNSSIHAVLLTCLVSSSLL